MKPIFKRLIASLLIALLFMSELTPLAHASAGNETGVGTGGEPIPDPHTAAPWGHYAQPPQNRTATTIRPSDRGLIFYCRRPQAINPHKRRDPRAAANGGTAGESAGEWSAGGTEPPNGSGPAVAWLVSPSGGKIAGSWKA